MERFHVNLDMLMAYLLEVLQYEQSMRRWQGVFKYDVAINSLRLSYMYAMHFGRIHPDFSRIQSPPPQPHVLLFLILVFF